MTHAQREIPERDLVSRIAEIERQTMPARRQRIRETDRLTNSGRASAFGRAIDLKQDSDIDANGQTHIGPIVREYAQDQSTLLFGPGEYLVTQTINLGALEDFALVGSGATLVPADGMTEPMFRVGSASNPASDVRMEGFTVDYSAASTGCAAGVLVVDSGLEVLDMDVVGYHDTGSDGPFQLAVTNEFGAGYVEQIEALDGGAFSTNTDGTNDPVCINLLTDSSGTIYVRDSRIYEWPSYGIYAPNNASLVVEGCRLKDNQRFQIRGGDAFIRDCDIVMDNVRSADTPTLEGLLFDEGGDLAVVNGCSFRQTDAVDNRARLVEVFDTMDYFQCTDTFMRMDKGYRGLHLRADNGAANGAHIRGLSILGTTTDGGFAVQVNRDDTTLSDVVVDTTETGRKGVLFGNCENVVARGCNVTCDDNALVANNTTNLTWRDNTTDPVNGYDVVIQTDAVDTSVMGGNLKGGLVDDGGTETHIGDDVRGYTVTAGGTATFSGDGATTKFAITHGLDEVPAAMTITPDLSTDATPVDGVTSVGNTGIQFQFSSAPASGTDNVDVYWEATSRP